MKTLLAPVILTASLMLGTWASNSSAQTPPAPENWQTLDYPLADYAGKTIGIVIKVSYGGKNVALNEEAFFDEISVIEKP